MSATCFHCNEPLGTSKLTAIVGDRDEPVCCAGCRAVAELIAGAGFSQYYAVRSQAPSRPEAALLQADTWSAFENPAVAATITQRTGDTDAVTLGIDGLRCAACAWLIDKVVGALDGVQEVSTNLATGRVHVRWRNSRLSLAEVMRAIARAGYRPFPPGDLSIAEHQQSERRSSLRHLAVAAFGMMQVMMFAVASYSAELNGEIIDPELLSFFSLVSMLVATPVMFYTGMPILSGAVRSVRLRTISMDVPVASALVLAYGASVYSTLTGRLGDLYFDSVTMFIFFVTLGRFVQMSVRHRTTGITDALARQMPSVAHRIRDGVAESIPAASLALGDIVLVKRGEIVPADGALIDDEASVDESLLTGESLAVRRMRGAVITGGSLNVGHPFSMRLTAAPSQSVVAHIVALLERAQGQRPVISAAADRASRRFLIAVIVSAVATAAGWMIVDSSQAFGATLAVLVVACPCAFAIAMPAATSAGIAALARKGVLVSNPAALEALAAVDRAVVDKTGTLTHGRLRIARTHVAPGVDRIWCQTMAAALESSSEHPIAKAFRLESSDLPATNNVRVHAGLGIEGIVHGTQYRLGTRKFISLPIDVLPDPQPASTVVLLADEHRILAQFELQDELRSTAPACVNSLGNHGIATAILSGDRLSAVEAVGDSCGISERHAACSPEEKLERLRALQSQGHRVLAVGDGVNDAPLLGAADVSVAMGRGTALAHSSADMILMNEDLRALPAAIDFTRRVRRIVRQNLFWAAAYNFGSLPLAAFGLVPPWVAALGMSLSSILVIANATRLLPKRSAAERSRFSSSRGSSLPAQAYGS
ncbi:Cu2+-exporting ATPase [Povalibacter uvarum]|uniref:Cu2+-exporting ATPase n=1 Tax=Povalibacter uvarum TaxID=732238 RepID=A0A841HIT7_9GAMM|nr:heavy metal translocating P-type ATPase [Povalibacter uvarum]MBB6092138.1 Cu2+-exporting ATPase [Povalibacter uvarum]